jgi:hypothetical protein
MLPPFLQDVVSGVAGGAGFVAVLGFILKIFPSVWERLATSLLANVDWDKLPSNTVAAQLRTEVAAETDYHRKFDERLDEMAKDQIKPVIMQLIGLPGDHSREVAYELDKLEDLGADCWIVPVARDYITQHRGGTS